MFSPLPPSLDICIISSLFSTFYTLLSGCFQTQLVSKVLSSCGVNPVFLKPHGMTVEALGKLDVHRLWLSLRWATGVEINPSEVPPWSCWQSALSAGGPQGARGLFLAFRAGAACCWPRVPWLVAECHGKDAVARALCEGSGADWGGGCLCWARLGHAALISSVWWVCSGLSPGWNCHAAVIALLPRCQLGW